ncbi:Oxoglutarate iron-dependent dioxygenase [Chlorella sorokiniana]|uniref:Oxoglutarate iron-dependent dioxygenase n=1 Tax=Chlorella sorokiniana TaxID=3076 RepID=A0A2P6TQE6_CHLSO|nr:Oxoglutarate iron-dependent dioxygenase [Chlorella sorokiniana]|eukprot:PRW56261.1 Oxoglutarate iron-dependent dioxygenase [Chlorella sorokiniana]
MQEAGAIRPIPPEHLAAGGLPAADGSLYDRPAFETQMAERFLPVDLDTPGLRIMHFDPPVFTLPGFFTEEQCDDAVAAALESGTLVPSKVGGGNLKDMAYAEDNPYRTSSSVLLDAQVQAAHPRLRQMAAALQSKGLRLLGQGDGASWGPPGKLPAPGQYCYESLQMARYETGQHFLAHEDGFPAGLARSNGFQRHATLLVYLNSTQEGGATRFDMLNLAGGATRFDMLNLAVQPQKGKALLFFPAFADGTSDPRSLHTAEDAAEGNIKWVTQQWVARGLAGAAADPIQAALAGSLPLGSGSSSTSAAAPAVQPAQRAAAADEGPSAAEVLLAGKRSKGKKKGDKKKGGGGGGKGFGA